MNPQTRPLFTEVCFLRQVLKVLLPLIASWEAALTRGAGKGGGNGRIRRELGPAHTQQRMRTHDRPPAPG